MKEMARYGFILALICVIAAGLLFRILLHGNDVAALDWLQHFVTDILAGAVVDYLIGKQQRRNRRRQ